MADRDLVVTRITCILVTVLSFFTFKKKSVKADPKLFLSEILWVSGLPNSSASVSPLWRLFHARLALYPRELPWKSV